MQTYHRTPNPQPRPPCLLAMRWLRKLQQQPHPPAEFKIFFFSFCGVRVHDPTPPAHTHTGRATELSLLPYRGEFQSCGRDELVWNKLAVLTAQTAPALGYKLKQKHPYLHISASSPWNPIHSASVFHKQQQQRRLPLLSSPLLCWHCVRMVHLQPPSGSTASVWTHSRLLDLLSLDWRRF